MRELELFLQALLTLRQHLVDFDAGERSAADMGFGICHHLETKLDVEFDSYQLVGRFSLGWPKHSGVVEYPVPSPDGLTPRYAYEHTCPTTGDAWTAAYGQLRRELLDFLIETVSAELGAQP